MKINNSAYDPSSNAKENISGQIISQNYSRLSTGPSDFISYSKLIFS